MLGRILLSGAVAASALIGAVSGAQAADRHGWYFGLEGGWVHTDDNGAFVSINTQWENGWAGIGTVGYAFHDHWRLELEGGYRRNELDKIGGISFDVGDLRNYTVMANIVWDAPISNKWALSLGAGIGADDVYVNFFGLHNTDVVFAAQGLVGLDYQMSAHWDLFLNYRYLWAADPQGFLGLDTFDLQKHTISIGFRYGYDEPPHIDNVTTCETRGDCPKPPTHFVIFFSKECAITPEADMVLSEAGASWKAVGAARITIVGHTDTLGSAKRNQKISECRANAAKANLVGKGVPEAAISASGRGESELMVQTPDNVKEPQNNNAVIDVLK